MTTPDPKFREKAWSFLKRSPFVDVIKFLLVIAALTWLMARGTERLGYNWQWYRVPQYILSFENGDFVAGPLLLGLMVTLRISAVSLVLSFVLGLVTALFRLSNSFLARSVGPRILGMYPKHTAPGAALFHLLRPLTRSRHKSLCFSRVGTESF